MMVGCIACGRGAGISILGGMLAGVSLGMTTAVAYGMLVVRAHGSLALTSNGLLGGVRNITATTVQGSDTTYITSTLPL